MTNTDNYGLNLCESTDKFGTALPTKINENFTILDNALGGFGFSKCTQEEYDAMETHGEKTLYFVSNEKGEITMYIGDVELKSGQGSPTGNVIMSPSAVVSEIMTSDLTVESEE